MRVLEAELAVDERAALLDPVDDVDVCKVLDRAGDRDAADPVELGQLHLSGQLFSHLVFAVLDLGEQVVVDLQIELLRFAFGHAVPSQARPADDSGFLLNYTIFCALLQDVCINLPKKAGIYYSIIFLYAIFF